jgi:hypothetical protein
MGISVKASSTLCRGDDEFDVVVTGTVYPATQDTWDEPGCAAEIDEMEVFRDGKKIQVTEEEEKKLEDVLYEAADTEIEKRECDYDEDDEGYDY